MKNQHKKHNRTQLFAGSLALSALIFMGAGCGAPTLEPPEPAEIEVWRSGAQLESLQELAQAYSQVYPHVSFAFETYTEAEYEQRLLDAWAKGEGPDIFSVPNMRLGEYVHKGLTQQMPESAALRRAYSEKSFGKTNVVVEERNVLFPNETQIKDQFANVVAGDVVFEGAVHGLPYNMDTMVLYYNRDLLARANVAVPPTTWTEFKNAVEAMVELDDEDNIVLPAAALGTAANVPHYFDLVSVLMMQNGASMVSENNNFALFSQESATRGGFFPGQEAVGFYTAFADQALRTYTWNAEQPDALEAFTQGSLGFYFGYLADKADIDQRSPSLNYSYVKLPQVDPANPVSIAQYNIESVHVNSEHAEHAWNFINFVASQENMPVVIEELGGVPSRKALIGELQEDPALGIVAQQALTAKTWYHGTNPDEALTIFAEMIQDANEKVDELEAIVILAAQKINLTLQQ